MKYFPVMLAVEGRRVLVVGGGKVAERKVETLLEYGAEVLLVSREVTPALQALAESGRIHYLGQAYEPSCLSGAFLAVAATDDAELNHVVSEDAQARGILINAVDQPADCTFILPSIVKRGDLVLAVSTSGRSPATAKRIRRSLETLFGPEYALFLRMMGCIREAVMALGLTQEENSRVFHELAGSRALEAIGRGAWPEVEAILAGILPGGLDPQGICRAAQRGAEAEE